MSQFHVLILHKDDAFVAQTTAVLERTGTISVELARDAPSAAALVTANPDRFSLVLLDYDLELGRGLEVASQLLSLDTHLSILFFCKDTSEELCALRWNGGSIGFLEQSATEDRLLHAVKTRCEDCHGTQ